MNCQTPMTLTRTNSAVARSAAALPQLPDNLPMSPGDRLLTSPEAAKMMNISVETLKKWRQRGGGPAFIKYPGGRVRYRVTLVLQFVSDCTIGR